MSAATKETAVDTGPSRLSQLKLLVQLLPKIPLAARVALLHVLRVSEPSKYLDLRTEVTIAVLRSFMTPSKPMSITHTQKVLNRDPGIKGRIWVSKYTAPAPPGSGVRDAVLRAITSLHQGDTPLPASLLDRLSDTAAVEAEWTGYRAGATPSSRLPPISEQDKYAELTKETTTPTTILYFHGGAYYLMDPASHRPTCKKLAKLTGGRCYSVRYRLAPQHPFPAAVLDALVSYLTLLHPPPGAFHAAVRPEHVVFAGDSAGGNLSFALLQTILELNRQSSSSSSSSSPRSSLPWHDNTTIPLPLPLPAGIAANSPWLDLTHSSPSCTANAAFDYLPAFDGSAPGAPPPPCPAWPAEPPRRSLYVADELVAHPLVTLLTARGWTGAPPAYLCTGWELLADEDRFLAAKLRADGVARVVFEQYEAMPHCFAMVFPKLEGSRRCFEGWAGFIREVTAGGEGKDDGGQSRFVTVKAGSLEEVPLEVDKVAPYEEAVMRERVAKKAGKAVGGLDGTAAKL